MCSNYHPLVKPFYEKHLNPASIDLTLSNFVRWPMAVDGVRATDRKERKPYLIDVAHVPEGHTRLRQMADNAVILQQGDFILGSTIETVSIPKEMVARVEGKSSLGRIGLAVHITAGYIDPGFQGPITLEIVNFSPNDIKLRAGMRIAQLAVQLMDQVPDRPYGSDGVGHYQNQKGPTESRYRIAIDS